MAGDGIVIVEVQRPMMRLLVERFGRAIPNEELALQNGRGLGYLLDVRENQSE